MDYYVKVTTEQTFTLDSGKRRSHEQNVYLPSFSRVDAEQTMRCLFDRAEQNHRSGGTTYHRTFQVVGSIWTGKGRIYLSLDALQHIADEYPCGENSQARAAE